MANIVEINEVHHGQNFQSRVYYEIGGMNYFTGTPRARGYYAAVTPVTITKYDGHSISEFSAFSGVCTCILQVARKSAKAEKQAVLLSEDAFKLLLPTVIEKWKAKHEGNK